MWRQWRSIRGGRHWFRVDLEPKLWVRPDFQVQDWPIYPLLLSWHRTHSGIYNCCVCHCRSVYSFLGYQCKEMIVCPSRIKGPDRTPKRNSFSETSHYLWVLPVLRRYIDMLFDAPAGQRACNCKKYMLQMRGLVKRSRRYGNTNNAYLSFKYTVVNHLKN